MNNLATVTAVVGDKFNNPVPAGTAVFFTTTGGVVTTYTGYTDEEGVVTVTLHTALTFGTTGTPNASVTSTRIRALPERTPLFRETSAFPFKVGITFVLLKNSPPPGAEKIENLANVPSTTGLFLLSITSAVMLTV